MPFIFSHLPSLLFTFIVGTSLADNIAATSADLQAISFILASNTLGLIFSDTGNHRYRKISSNGIVTTIAGTVGVAGYSGDGGPGTSAVFNSPGAMCLYGTLLYLLDGSNYRIRRLDTATGIVTFVAGSGSGSDVDGVGTAASFGTFFGCAVDATGIVYVAIPLSNLVRVVTSTGSVSSLSVYIPYNLCFDASNNLYVSSFTSTIYRRPSTGGSFELFAGTASTPGFANGIATNALFDNPRGLSVDAGGSIYVADLSNYRIRKIDLATASVTTFAGSGSSTLSGDGGPALSAGMSYPSDTTVDIVSGTVYAVDFTFKIIRYV